MVFCYFAILPSIVAIVLGASAVKQIDGSNGAQGGRGMAVAGIVLGSAWIGLPIIALIVFAASG